MGSVDTRGRLQGEPFSYRATKDGRVLVSFQGRRIAVVAGTRATRLLEALRQAEGDPGRVQLLLAKVTGHFKHGNER